MQPNLDVSLKIYFAYAAIRADFFSVIDLSRKTTAFGSLGVCDYALFELEFPIHSLECVIPPSPPPPCNFIRAFHQDCILMSASARYHMSFSSFTELVYRSAWNKCPPGVICINNKAVRSNRQAYFSEDHWWQWKQPRSFIPNPLIAFVNPSQFGEQALQASRSKRWGVRVILWKTKLLISGIVLWITSPIKDTTGATSVEI